MAKFHEDEDINLHSARLQCPDKTFIADFLHDARKPIFLAIDTVTKEPLENAWDKWKPFPS